VIFQCPASFRPTDENLANLRGFFGRIERGGLRLGFEPRGEAWRDDLIAELCAELSLIHVVDPLDRAPATPPEASTPRYFRLHGIGGYHYTYSEDELRRLREMCDAPRTYCMFNNDAMRDDAQRFRALLDTASKSA